MKGPLRFTVGDCFLSIIVLQFDPQSPVSPFHYLSLTWKATPHSIKHTPLVNTHFHPGTQILSLMFTFSYFPSLPIFLTPFHYYHPLSIFSLSLSFIFTILSLFQCSLSLFFNSLSISLFQSPLCLPFLILSLFQLYNPLSLSFIFTILSLSLCFSHKQSSLPFSLAKLSLTLTHKSISRSRAYAHSQTWMRFRSLSLSILLIEKNRRLTQSKSFYISIAHTYHHLLSHSLSHTA